MDLGLKDKIILVTGGAKGIGAAITSILAQEGAVPVIIGRSEADNQAHLQHIQQAGGKGAQVVAELTDPTACEQAIASIAAQFGRIDGLVNNAGINDGVGLKTGSYEGFMQSLHRNLVHYYLMAHHALPFLIAAETGQGNTSAYAAANGGRNALTREWAVELRSFGIRVNAIIVAESWTPLYESWINTFPDKEAKLASIVANIPFGKRMTHPEEIAQTTAFLLSEKSSHTTGQLIHVDGGYVHLDRALI